MLRRFCRRVLQGISVFHFRMKWLRNRVFMPVFHLSWPLGPNCTRCICNFSKVSLGHPNTKREFTPTIKGAYRAQNLPHFRPIPEVGSSTARFPASTRLSWAKQSRSANSFKFKNRHFGPRRSRNGLYTETTGTPNRNLFSILEISFQKCHFPFDFPFSARF